LPTCANTGRQGFLASGAESHSISPQPVRSRSPRQMRDKVRRSLGLMRPAQRHFDAATLRFVLAQDALGADLDPPSARHPRSPVNAALVEAGNSTRRHRRTPVLEITYRGRAIQVDQNARSYPHSDPQGIPLKSPTDHDPNGTLTLKSRSYVRSESALTSPVDNSSQLPTCSPGLVVRHNILGNYTDVRRTRR
jgi:hypothetical protein